MRRALNHLQSNVVAYLALFVALGGTSYAAVSLPANSVGNRQIRNHSIDPVKLNPKTIAGSVRAWASVNGQGKIVASSGGARIVASVVADQLTWPAPLSQRCAPVVSPGNPKRPGATTDPAFADASIVRENPRRLGVLVSLFSSTGQGPQPSRQAYSVVVVCPTPR